MRLLGCVIAAALVVVMGLGLASLVMPSASELEPAAEILIEGFNL